MYEQDAIAAGVRRSIDDLSTEGLDLIDLPEQRVRDLIREHIDYFQMMIGPNTPAEEDQILAAVLRERQAPAGHVSGVSGGDC